MRRLDSKSNPLAVVATDSIERLRSVAVIFSDVELTDEGMARLFEEVACHKKTLEVAFEQRKKWGPKLGSADSGAYFSEKLAGLISFVRMSVSPRERGGFEMPQVIENIDHYSHAVAKLVDANWSSHSRKPATDKTIRDASFANREALRRLVDR